MRVITGTARGTKLMEPDGNRIRPTTDVVKESIFNIIQFDIEGRQVLDLFAGTGQMGIEALSRGARHAVFVDESTAAVKLIRENLARTRLAESSKVVQQDFSSLLQPGQKFDLIFLDPPYEGRFLDKALAKIVAFDILREGGIIVCESKADKGMPEPEKPYLKGKEYRYGTTKVTVYGKQGL